MAAYLLMVSLIYVTINLVVDILYTVVDPRLRSTITARPEQREFHVRRRLPHPANPSTARCRAGRAGYGAAFESDIFYSFTRSKLTMWRPDHAVVLPVAIFASLLASRTRSIRAASVA